MHVDSVNQLIVSLIGISFVVCDIYVVFSFVHFLANSPSLGLWQDHRSKPLRSRGPGAYDISSQTAADWDALPAALVAHPARGKCDDARADSAGLPSGWSHGLRHPHDATAPFPHNAAALARPDAWLRTSRDWLACGRTCVRRKPRRYGAWLLVRSLDSLRAALSAVLKRDLLARLQLFTGDNAGSKLRGQLAGQLGS